MSPLAGTLPRDHVAGLDHAPFATLEMVGCATKLGIVSFGVWMKGRWLGLITVMVTLDVPVKPSLSLAVTEATYVPSFCAVYAILGPVPVATRVPLSVIDQE